MITRPNLDVLNAQPLDEQEFIAEAFVDSAIAYLDSITDSPALLLSLLSSVATSPDPDHLAFLTLIVGEDFEEWCGKIQTAIQEEFYNLDED